MTDFPPYPTHAHENTITAFFDPSLKEDVRLAIKKYGVTTVTKDLIRQGFHESYVKALIRHLIRKYGW